MYCMVPDCGAVHPTTMIIAYGSGCTVLRARRMKCRMNSNIQTFVMAFLPTPYKGEDFLRRLGAIRIF